MAVTVRTAINRVYQEFKPEVLGSYRNAARVWPEYAMEVQSSSRSTIHGWLGNQANVREWLGARVAKSLATRTWEVVNRKWELTYEFDRDQIDDDLSGLISGAVMQARQFGVKYARHEDLLVAQTLEAGATALCWDGQFFFDTDHPTDFDGVTSGTYVNKLTTSALTAATFNTALVTMMGYKLEDGTPMVSPGSFVLMVPPALALTGKTLLEIDLLAPAAAIGIGGTTGTMRNPFYGAAKLVVNPFLTSATTWYLLASDGNIKPLMLQRRRGVEVDELDESSESYFKQERYYIGSSARYTASFTLPQLAIQATA